MQKRKIIQKGEVVLVKFPFTDFEDFKLRPAVVLIGDNKYGDVCLAFITSKIMINEDNNVVIIKEGDKDFKQTGLKFDSMIRVNKIITVQKDLIAGRIGPLSKKYLEKLDATLKNIFKI